MANAPDRTDLRTKLTPIQYAVTQKADLRLMAITRSHEAPSVSSTERSRSFHRTPALL